MLKVLIVADAPDAQTILQKIEQLSGVKVMGTIAPSDLAQNLSQVAKVDCVLTANATVLAKLAQPDNPPRQHIKAVTHQGIRLVPVENIYFFQAEHKYVTAIHTHGQLLIEDSLNSLEDEFPATFVRIHRKTLVAKQRIQDLQKNDQGQYFVKLDGVTELLSVSRRQVPHLRKILLSL